VQSSQFEQIDAFSSTHFSTRDHGHKGQQQTEVDQWYSNVQHKNDHEHHNFDCADSEEQNQEISDNCGGKQEHQGHDDAESDSGVDSGSDTGLLAEKTLETHRGTRVETCRDLSKNTQMLAMAKLDTLFLYAPLAAALVGSVALCLVCSTGYLKLVIILAS
jgi:hypothetical protein